MTVRDASHAFISAFSGLEAKYRAALVAAAGTVIVSVMSAVVSRYLEARATLRKELREKKIPVYEDLPMAPHRLIRRSNG